MPRIFPILLISCLFVVTVPAFAQTEQSLAYQLALLHTKAIHPDQAFLKKKVRPEQAIISEFQWIIDSLKYRCINPDPVFATTIVETWRSLQQNRIYWTLLDVARDLLRASRNTKVFGTDKVNFRMTSRFWLISKISKQDITKVFQAYLANQKSQR